MNECDVMQSWTVSFVLPAVYHALYLEELTLLDLSEKIALLYSISPQQITHIYRQKANGIHVLVSDEVSLHLLYQPLTFDTHEQYLIACSLDMYYA